MVVDLMLPDGDGAELVAEISSTPLRSSFALNTTTGNPGLLDFAGADEQ